MPTWEGFVTDVLDAVESLLSKKRQELGIRDVMIGETKKGWNTPAVFIYLDGPATRSTASARKGADEYTIPIRIQLLERFANHSGDRAVIARIEKILDVLDENVSLGDTIDHHYPSPAAAAPATIAEGGAYTTVGGIVVSFRKVYCRDIR